MIDAHDLFKMDFPEFKKAIKFVKEKEVQDWLEYAYGYIGAT